MATESTAKTFTLKEVSAHNKEEDLWMVINGKVYDVTKFTDEHPGGVDTLLDVAGADGTSEFEGVGHSEAARAQLKNYYVGELAPGEKAVAMSKAPSGTNTSASAIAFVVALVAVMLYLIMRQ